MKGNKHSVSKLGRKILGDVRTWIVCTCLSSLIICFTSLYFSMTDHPVLNESGDQSELTIKGHSESVEAIDQLEWDEADVRYRMLDIQLGKVLGFYFAQRYDDPSNMEAIKRWEAGIRISNLEEFERRNIPGKGWTIVYRNTNYKVDTSDILLT